MQLDNILSVDDVYSEPVKKINKARLWTAINLIGSIKLKTLMSEDKVFMKYNLLAYYVSRQVGTTNITVKYGKAGNNELIQVGDNQYLSMRTSIYSRKYK